MSIPRTAIPANVLTPSVPSLPEALSETLIPSAVVQELGEAGFSVGAGFMLTPETLLHVLRQRLGDMDDQMGSLMGAIENKTNTARALQQRGDLLQKLKAAIQARKPDGGTVDIQSLQVEYNGEMISGDDLLEIIGAEGLNLETVPVRIETEGDRRIADMEDNLLEAEAELAEHGKGRGRKRKVRRLKKQLRQERESVAEARALGEEYAYTDGTGLTAESIDSAIQGLQSKVREVNSGNEMLMVQLQSATQQRSQAITMVTQILRTIKESETQIARNI